MTTTASGMSTLARDQLPADLPCINARWEESELALLRESTGATYGYGLATVTVIDRQR